MNAWLKDHQKIGAGVWFGAIGLVISRSILIVHYHEPLIGFDVIHDSFAVLASVICGALFGSKIIRVASLKMAGLSVRRGAVTMLLSFIVYSLLIAMLTAIIDRSIGYALGILFEFMFGGLILFGWLVGVLGAISGWVLYRLSKPAS